MFNAMVENKEYFIAKWQERLENGNLLQRYKVKRAKVMVQFDIDLYFAIVEKIMIYDSGRLIVSFLDGTDIECVIE